MGSSSYITNLDGEVVQHVEYVPFGEVFLEEKNAVWNTPYLFNGKELDKETGMSYYGARYYESKTSVWLNVDPLAVYNPVMEHEFYGDGDHNGGVYNSGNLNSYGYCYQNPVRYVDPNGKQVDFNYFNKSVKSHDNTIIKGLTKVTSYVNTLQIGAHGNTQGIYPVVNGAVEGIKTPAAFDKLMSVQSKEWRENKNNENFTVILYSCRTGQTPTKKGIKQAEAFAKQLSKAFPNITVIAPDQRLYVSGKGPLGTYEAKYQDIDGEYNKKEYNIFGWSFGKLLKDMSNIEGSWNVYKGGDLIKQYEGDWTPKPSAERTEADNKKLIYDAKSNN